MPPLAALPDPPYYAVIFSSRRTGSDDGYDLAAQRMMALAKDQPGFLGVESVRDADGFGITVSYWRDLDSLKAWGRNREHQVVQRKGAEFWYGDYRLLITRVESSRTARRQGR
ncbi:antibiotic biosynthesis monooxygenase [Magnetospira sp. QH-2]|uniref:antibiotic biosynthesis monooxygenase family protein n=1 Tax=Magnetospira sp. (strain QH-2) TaxID=1288970 RepID=UPI0003E80EA9|nr:antibiotic biosynthesis monooxygenase [Magnetospira sp. QH-2]CCQ72086.1 conserved protein of unknown function [Magnetospira sp. QH-2]